MRQRMCWEMHNCFSALMLWPQTWRYVFPITRLPTRVYIYIYIWLRWLYAAVAHT